MIDSHCHLNDPDIYPLIDDILKRAMDVGVTHFIVPGYDLKSSELAVEIAARYSMCSAVIGLHPHEADSFDEKMADAFRALGKEQGVVGYGEIGLDYHYEPFSKEKQQEAFREQIRMAKDLSLPLVIHSRDGAKDTMDILKKEAMGMEGVMHCYGGSLEMAREYIRDLNFYISLAGPVTFKNAKTPKEVAKGIPLSSLLIETDCPYLTPHPYRGKMNEPSYLPYVLEAIAELREIPRDEVERVTMENTQKLFDLKEGNS